MTRARVSRPSASHVISNYFKLLECLGTPVALSCWMLGKSNQWADIFAKKIDPTNYDNPQDFRDDYLAVSVLKKSNFLDTGLDRRETALARFREGEEACRETNNRLSLYAASKLMPKDFRVHAVLHRAREHIQKVLGVNPGTRHGAFKPRFGPGVTSSVTGQVVISKKYMSRIDVTPRLYSYRHDLLGVHQRGLDVRLVASNRVTFVPKDYKTHRSIAIEPHLNVYAQLGVGGLIREALRCDGLDLTNQSELNRFLASIAHEARLATIDLSMASDTLCRELVWLLLPERWADLLDTVRSPFGVLDGVEFEYEKFSSMGNGSTFELETLIFWALALACGSRRSLTSVFGDDIIVEQEVADLLIEVLAFCGFSVNRDKSFLSGSFFESCGSDFFQGVNVRPFFWKELEPPLYYKMANDVSSYARIDSHYLDSRFLPSWLRCVSAVPHGMRVSVPRGYGDVGIVNNFDAPTSHITFRSDTRSYRFLALRFRTRIVTANDLGSLGA